MFTERTRQNAPHFELTDQNAAEVASLCRYLEGLPLAIELAAAHSGGKNLTHLLKQLQRSTRWLRERPAGTLSRSLYASLTTVYRSLPPEARLFWMRLSVFRAGFTLKAAQAVASPPDAAAALPELERRSLVQAQDGRYRLLEPLRLFAETQLKECGVTEETRLAHLRYYLKLATALGDAPTHWAELEQERENLHAALEWGFHYAPLLMLALVEALELFWERRGCEQATYQRLLQLPYQFRSAEEAVRAARVALNLAVRRGDMEQAQLLMEQYLPIADALPENSLAAARFWIVAGFFAWMQGDYDRSVELLQRAIQRARISNAALDEATAWVHLGVAHWTRQELEEAANALQRTLQLIAPLETPILRMKAMSNLANVLYQMGKREEAESYLAETLLLAQQLGDRRTAATLLNNWAVWMREQGDYERARELCLQAGAIWQELHEAIGETASVFNLADIALQVGDVETASFMFHRSLESILRYRLFWYLPPCLEKLAELARRENNLSQARAWQCARLYASLRFGQPNQIAPSLQALAELALAREAFPEAARWTLLMEPIGKRTPPDNLLETLRKRFAPTEWRRFLQEAHSIQQEELIEQLQPYFDELSLPYLSC
ncbi:MAG: tetratricopeptide repeat protein [Fimbriimonadales bacterium]|nr:tetratricopeptide repeat protein [Fimbriimonadales bacterium]